MISRKKILSQSCDKIMEDCKHYENQEIWFNQEQLFKDHIREIMDKWDQLDDDIWAKVIFMERNRRVAKAYVRAQVISLNGSEKGFDGHVVGLRGFQKSWRDEKSEAILENIGEVNLRTDEERQMDKTHLACGHLMAPLIVTGFKMKIEESGDILVKRLGSNSTRVITENTSSSTLGQDLIDSKGFLQAHKAMTLFQIKKLIINISKELQSPYPDRKTLERQCISCICFDCETENILQSACWMMVINIVALEMIKIKLPLTIRENKVPEFVAVFRDTSNRQNSQQISEQVVRAVQSTPNTHQQVQHSKSQNGESISVCNVVSNVMSNAASNVVTDNSNSTTSTSAPSCNVVVAVKTSHSKTGNSKVPEKVAEKLVVAEKEDKANQRASRVIVGNDYSKSPKKKDLSMELDYVCKKEAILSNGRQLESRRNNYSHYISSSNMAHQPVTVIVLKNGHHNTPNLHVNHSKSSLSSSSPSSSSPPSSLPSSCEVKIPEPDYDKIDCMESKTTEKVRRRGHMEKLRKGPTERSQITKLCQFSQRDRGKEAKMKRYLKSLPTIYSQ